MKSQIEHINIHSFHLISEMFTIYLPFHMARKLALNFCYQSEYKLTNCTMPYSKANTNYVCIPIYKIITTLFRNIISKILVRHFFKTSL